MRKAFRHTGVLMMLAVVALGLLGAAYTLWYENLTVTVDVTTGTFDADWSCEEFQTWVPGDNGQSNNIDDDTNCDGPPASYRPTYAMVVGGGAPAWCTDSPTGCNPLKLTQTCDADISTDSAAGGNDAEDDNHLTLTLSNLYPFTGCEFSIDLHNDGTTPLHLTVTDADLGTLNNWLNIDILVGSSPTCGPLIAAIMGHHHSEGPTPVEGVQLHPSDEILCNIRIWVQEDYHGQVLAEGASGTITATVKAHQWNEQPQP